MKIVQACGYYPPHIGGLEFCAKYISEQLGRNGHDVTVLTSNVGAGTARVETSTPNVNVHYLRSFEFAHTPFSPGLPWQLLRLDRDSLLHVHLSHVYTETVVFLMAKLRRIPYVAHFHMDVDVSGPFGFLFRLYKKTVLPFVIRGAAHVIALSEEQRELVIRRYKLNPHRVTIVPNGVTEDYFVDRSRNYRQAPLKLLFVGRFALQKNIPRLIRALPLIHHPVELHLVGDGEKRPEIESLIQELNLTNVHLHGRKSGQELVQAYVNGDIFVIPSDREGMPLTLVEAAATGLPIVASKVQGLREFIGEVGVLVADPSPETFAAELNRLIEHPEELETLSRQSREWAQQLSWAQLVKRIEHIYDEVKR